MAGAVAHTGSGSGARVSLSAALEKWPQAFAPLSLAMIRTGELTGKLDFCCLQLARQQQEQQQLADKVKKAVRYPAVILGLALMWWWRCCASSCQSLRRFTKPSTHRYRC
ncbi:type IV pilin biogenesis protein [Raoultella planticola]|uniref:Type IV pilin biogenesis protein n=1 Tax=Raoultella planticola TaxID=575 RepID=A0A485AZ19_RAOPL|nr:type IV pilin biogenesis protein [Raoultella planticola]